MLVSGDDMTAPILGYADSGSFHGEALAPAMKTMLDNFARRVQQRRANDVGISYQTGWTAVEPLLGDIEWGQNDPFFGQTPEIDGEHCAVGCVATAMAMIMNYYKWPEKTLKPIPAYTTGSGMSLPELPVTTFEWEAMKSSYKVGETGPAVDAVAKLMRYCGQAVEMGYAVGNSASSGICSKELVEYFGYAPKSMSLIVRSIPLSNGNRSSTVSLLQGVPCFTRVSRALAWDTSSCATDMTAKASSTSTGDGKAPVQDTFYCRCWTIATSMLPKVLSTGAAMPMHTSG